MSMKSILRHAFGTDAEMETPATPIDKADQSIDQLIQVIEHPEKAPVMTLDEAIRRLVEEW